VQPRQVTVLADTALRAEQLDESAADEARKAAEAALKGASTKEDLAHAQGQLVEASARYRAAQKLKGKRGS
jgi:F-type H+-transporting ATPase subunit epsilon